MKSKTLLAVAVAGAFTCGSGAFAGSGWNGYEVRTPSSVDESAPWLANEPHMPSSTSTMRLTSINGDPDAMIPPMASARATVNTAYTEYWLLGSEGSDIGASSGSSGIGSVAFDSTVSGSHLADSSQGYGLTTSAAGSGNIAFDSTAGGGERTSANELVSYSFEPSASAFEMVLFTPAALEVIHDVGDKTPLLSEHFLIPMPESAYDPSQVAVLMIGPASEDIALLDALKAHFVVLTPDFGET